MKTAVEFIAKPEDGIIRIPKELQEELAAEVRVIILSEQRALKRPRAKKASFKALKLKTKGFKFSRDEANER